MSQRPKHRSSLKQAALGAPRELRNSGPTRGGGMGRALVWLLLGGYLLAYWLWPLSVAVARSGQVLRRGHFWLTLVLADETIGRWVEGCSWTSLAERAHILASAAGVLLVAISAGWICITLGKLDRMLTRLECGVFSAAVGLNLVSLATLLLGLGGVLRRNVFLAAGLSTLAAAGVLAILRSRDAAPTPVLAALGDDAPSDELRVSPRWLWAAAPFVVAIVASAMLPPFDFDVREYHLQAPKEFYEAGQITFLPHNVYANMPLGAEMLALAAMVLARDWWLGALVGKTLIAVFAPLTALALLAAGRRFVTLSAGVLAALIYISTPWIALVSSQGLVEGVGAFYLFTALVAVWMWAQRTGSLQREWRVGGARQKGALRDKPAVAHDKAQNKSARAHDKMTMPPDQPSSAVTSTGLLLLGGFLSGAAVATKYPEVIFCALPLAAFVGYRSLAPGRLVHVERWQSAGALAALALFLSASAVGCGPWLVKNALATGNPVYPLLYDVFGGATRTPAKEAQWSRAHRPPGYSPGDLASRAVGFAIGSDWLSPLAAPLAVLAWWSRRRRPIVQHLTAYLLYALAAWWLLTHRIERFWVPILPIVALLAGIGALWSAQRWWRATLAAFVSAGLAFSFAVVTGGQLADTRYLAPLATLRNDPDRVEPWHLYINEHAGEITGLLLVGDAQPFDLTVPVLYNTVFDDSIFEDIARGRGDAEISSELARRGISHIYVSWREIERYRSPGNYGFTSFVEPDVFRHLVSSGVLEELPQLADDSGEMFRVLPGKRAR